MALLDEGQTTCCYARSEKHWVTDPQGIAWEHFHTLDTSPSSVRRQSRSRPRGLLHPHAARQAHRHPVKSQSSCC